MAQRRPGGLSHRDRVLWIVGLQLSNEDADRPKWVVRYGLGHLEKVPILDRGAFNQLHFCQGEEEGEMLILGEFWLLGTWLGPSGETL